MKKFLTQGKYVIPGKANKIECTNGVIGVLINKK